MAKALASAKLKTKPTPAKGSASLKSKQAPKAKPVPAPVLEDVEESGSGSSESEEESGSEEESELDEEEDGGVDQEGLKRLVDLLEDGEGLDDIAKAQLEALNNDEGSEEGDEEGSDDDEGEWEDEKEDEEEQAESEEEDEEDEEESGSQEGAGDDDENMANAEEEAEDDKPRANPKAMKRMRELIQLDPTWPWTETLVTTWPETHEKIDPSDDLNREVSFYKQALQCAQESKALAAKHSLPFTRPNDYFAEMVKSDIHMERVRSKLLDEAAAMKRSEEAKRQRDLKKYGKQVQVEKTKERAKNKKEMLNKVESLKRKRGGGVDGLRDDEFDIALDETLNDDRPSPAKRGRAKGPEGKSRMSRKARDSKYHWGSGQAGGKHAKSNN
ncbi:rRNA-processing protein and EBNA1-binding protein ebp2, partial [Tulasnella sp. 408]